MLAHSPDPAAARGRSVHYRQQSACAPPVRPDRSGIVANHFDALCPANQPDGVATQVRLQICQQKNASSTPQRCKITMLGWQNQPLECDVALVP
jgi:hypothetical protein